jgi:uncharacterized protein YjiS (DUF1127 family)
VISPSGRPEGQVAVRHDFVFAPQHCNRDGLTQRYFSTSLTGEIAKLALILTIYELSRNSRPISGGSKQCEQRMPGSPIPTYRFMRETSFRTAANGQEQNRNKKMISLKTISEKLNARRRYREAVSELSKLSGHELSDIGISRSDIEYVARRPFMSKASA